SEVRGRLFGTPNNRTAQSGTASLSPSGDVWFQETVGKVSGVILSPLKTHNRCTDERSQRNSLAILQTNSGRFSADHSCRASRYGCGNACFHWLATRARRAPCSRGN